MLKFVSILHQPKSNVRKKEDIIVANSSFFKIQLQRIECIIKKPHKLLTKLK